MSQLPADQEQWVPCVPGSLVKYAVQRQRYHRRRTAIKIAAATLAIALVFGAGWLANRTTNPNPTEVNFGGIACHDVARLMPQYLAGELPAEQSEKIRLHLAQCTKCQEMMRRMQQRQAATVVGGIYADCPECQEHLATLLAAGSHHY